jgi:ABC-2 type transport system ATP-binding protein
VRAGDAGSRAGKYRWAAARRRHKSRQAKNRPRTSGPRALRGADARDNLKFFGALYGLAGAELDAALASALELVGLADRARDRVKVFSGGMKRRLNLAAGLLHNPDILLLDEPTVGVDPQSRNAIFDNLEQLKSRGKALLYTTHYMEEAQRLADRIVIIDHGKVIASDTVAGLTRGGETLESVFLTLTGRSLRD